MDAADTEDAGARTKPGTSGPLSSRDAPSKTGVPSSLAHVGIVLKYTFLDYLRSRRFVIMTTIILVIGAFLTILVAHYRPTSILSSPINFYSTWWGMFASDLAIILGIAFGGDGISAEFQNKTGYFTIPNPIRRSSIYIGKYIASFIASSLVLAFYLVVAILNGLYYFGTSTPYELGDSFLFAWFYLLAVIGFAFMFSSLFKTSSYSILVSFLLLFIGFSIISGLIQVLASTEPWYILNYGAEIISNVFTVPYPVTGTRFGITTFIPTIPEGLAIMGVYFVVTAVIGLLLFERKEFN
jgi:ABC-2 type transport system permease protein